MLTKTSKTNKEKMPEKSIQHQSHMSKRLTHKPFWIEHRSENEQQLNKQEEEQQADAETYRSPKL